MKRRVFRIASLAVFLAGLVLMVNSQRNITGGVIGTGPVISSITALIGLGLMIFVLVSFVTRKPEDFVDGTPKQVTFGDVERLANYYDNEYFKRD